MPLQDSARWGGQSFAAIPFSSPSTDETVSLDLAFSNEVTVLPGSSGLPMGAPVTLQFKTRVDGVTEHEGSSSIDDYWFTLGDVSGFYQIRDEALIAQLIAACPPFSETCFADADAQGTLIDFNMVSFSQQTGSLGLFTKEWSWSWSVASQGMQVAGDNDDFYGEIHCPSGSCGAPGELPPLEGVRGYPFDTGWLSVDFDTYIGAVLNIGADFNLFAEAYGGAGEGISANVDFLNTFGTQLLPVTPGIELDFAAVVPAPPALWLMISGLAGLAGLARRRGMR